MALVSGLAAGGCAAPSAPFPSGDLPFEDRVESQTNRGLTVSAAVPTRAEANAIYGVDLASEGMQPVWIEVENATSAPYWLLPSGVDPAYFSAAEAAYAFTDGGGSEADLAVARRFRALGFQSPVAPGATETGYLLVNRDEGFKAVDIDLISREAARSFTYIFLDPAFKGDFTQVQFGALYEPSEMRSIESDDVLRRVLETLPCCTTDADGSEHGDPLNLVLIGEVGDVLPAFIRRGWHATEVIWTAAVWRTIKSFVRGDRYRYSPISPLYAYGRRQDFAMQKARGTVHERNHLRFWLAPLRFRDKPVWIGQISRDIGVKFTFRSPTISTHVIDPDVDEARDYLVEDLAYSQAMARFGFVSGVAPASRREPRYNLVGDPYFTDGLRVVMFFEPRPRALGDLEALWNWESPSRVRAEQAGEAGR